MDREKIIESIEDYEPYARDLPCVTIKSGLILDVIALLKDQQNVISGLKVINDGLCEAVTEQKQIVRCKDCKHGVKTATFRYYQNLTWCIQHSKAHNDDWFCADGQKKDGGDNAE